MRHALVIEDNPLIAMMIKGHLREHGFTSVAVTRSQHEAISFAEKRCPDFITADDRLDGGSGVEAIRHICRERPIPVMFIDNHAGTHAATVKANGHWSKLG
jgi:CheY-like chemotaxis protein